MKKAYNNSFCKKAYNNYFYRKAYNAYGQSIEIDYVDISIINSLIKEGTYKVDFVLNNSELKKGYFITKYYNSNTKYLLNELFKNISNAKERIQRLMINGIIEKEYHYKYEDSFRLKIYCRLYKEHHINNPIIKIKKEHKKEQEHKIDNQQYVLRRILKEYKRRGLSMKRFKNIYKYAN